METTLLTSGDHSCRPLERLKPPEPALNTVPTGAVLVHQLGPDQRRRVFRPTGWFRKILGDQGGVIRSPAQRQENDTRCRLASAISSRPSDMSSP